ncbi:MAG: UvrB/UvrC motif-containing protein [Clostridiales bacterium]|nr:UvrB/UvrC motif-containing protein [Clostridiales bacterium]
MKSTGVPGRREPAGVMKEASKRLEFEYAAVLRNRIIELRGR